MLDWGKQNVNFLDRFKLKSGLMRPNFVNQWRFLYPLATRAQLCEQREIMARLQRQSGLPGTWT